MFKWDEGLVQVVHGFKSGVGMIRCEGKFWFGRVRGWGWFSRGGLAQVVRGFFFQMWGEDDLVKVSNVGIGGCKGVKIRREITVRFEKFQV